MKVLINRRVAVLTAVVLVSTLRTDGEGEARRPAEFRVAVYGSNGTRSAPAASICEVELYATREGGAVEVGKGLGRPADGLTDA